MRLPPLPALALSLCLCPALPAQNLAHEALALRFLERYERGDANPDTFDLSELLETKFLHFRLGDFRIHAPTDVDQDELEDLERVFQSLVDLEEAWVSVLAPALDEPKQRLKDLKEVRSWLRKLDVRDLVRSGGGGDLLDLFDADDDVREAIERLNGGRDSEPAAIVVVPGRERFVEFLCLGGWIYPAHRGTFWQAGIQNWTHFWIDEYQVLALEFASPGGGDWRAGLDMDYRTSTGLEQQFSQLAADALLAHHFRGKVPPSLAGALAVELVIDVYGECNTRVDGDLRARRTEAREVFVPGGNPDGGILPPHLADSRWRETHGADRFVQPLRQALVKRKKREPYRFELENDAGTARMEVSAPFLGAAADASRVPTEFYGDRLEFLRSYRTAFLHWLRTEAGKTSKSSAEAFARLLVALAENEDPEALEGVFEEIYGVPLSGPEPRDDHLEGAFLEWLEKQRPARPR